MEKKELTVVIVTFKSESKIYSCIDSIPTNVDVIVVENSNNINFKEKLENKYTNVRCLLNNQNSGYSVANNNGLKKVKTKYALVLNPDAKLKKNTLDNFFDSVKKNPNFSIIGPGNDQNYDHSINDDIFEVNDLKGFAIFLNIEKFNNDFFDENFFLYFEEIDLCKKVKKKGGQIYLDKNIIVDHEGGSSVKRENELELEKNRNWHWMWSTFYFHKKHKGFLLALTIILPKFFSSLIKIIFFQLIFNKEKRDIYFCRMSGILNSILGKKSWYRPSLD